MEHPSSFPSLLRRDRLSPSATPPRRDTPSPTHKLPNKRHSMGSFPNLSRTNIVNYRRDSTVSNGVREMKRDYVGSTNSLSRKSSKETFGSTTALSRKSSRDYAGSTNSLSRKSSIDTKKSSTDSLDMWHKSWDSDKNNSASSLAHDDRLSFGHQKVIITNSAYCLDVCVTGHEYIIDSLTDKWSQWHHHFISFLLGKHMHHHFVRK